MSGNGLFDRGYTKDYAAAMSNSNSGGGGSMVNNAQNVFGSFGVPFSPFSSSFGGKVAQGKKDGSTQTKGSGHKKRRAKANGLMLIGESASYNQSRNSRSKLPEVRTTNPRDMQQVPDQLGGSSPPRGFPPPQQRPGARSPQITSKLANLHAPDSEDSMLDHLQRQSQHFLSNASPARRHQDLFDRPEYK